MNEAMRILKERRSIRRYRPEQISREALDAILEAGLYAASAKNLQSTRLVAVQDRAVIDRMAKWNAEIWGREGVDPFFGAPTVVVVLSDSNYPNWLQDGALVMGNLMNAAAATGIGSCWVNRAMETFDRPEGKALLAQWGLTENWRGVGNCVLGYADEPLLHDMARKPDRILYI